MLVFSEVCAYSAVPRSAYLSASVFPFESSVWLPTSVRRRSCVWLSPVLKAGALNDMLHITTVPDSWVIVNELVFMGTLTFPKWSRVSFSYRPCSRLRVCVYVSPESRAVTEIRVPPRSGAVDGVVENVIA